MTEDEYGKIAAALQSEAHDGRIPCAGALDLARRLGVAPHKVGRACDRAHIKITNCQLGCFK